jgi:hypothetical protein
VWASKYAQNHCHPMVSHKTKHWVARSIDGQAVNATSPTSPKLPAKLLSDFSSQPACVQDTDSSCFLPLQIPE